jgi:hypothetical protein
MPPDPAATPAPGSPRLGRVARLVGALALPCLAGLLARMAGADATTWALLTGVASVAGILVASRAARATAGWAGIVVILVNAVTPLVVVGVLSETRALGPIRDLPVTEAHRDVLAAGFRLTDGATPRLDLREVLTEVTTWQAVRGGTGRAQSTFAIAPVLPPGWAPGQPVTAVAVAASRHELSRRVPDTAAWAAPGGLLRLLPDEAQTRAVHRALHRRGLEAAPDLVIGAWVADPARARLEGALPGLLLLGGAILVVLAVAG